ncbi:MAG: spore germination protein [Clostridiaceae bacterium]|nr:spore germination protein [Clostridiaceae bacterium]
MFREIYRKLNYLRLRAINENKRNLNHNNSSDTNRPIPKSIDKIKSSLQNVFSDCADVIIREFALGESSQVKFIIAFVEGLVEKEVISTHVLKSLMTEVKKVDLNKRITSHGMVKILKENLLSACEVNETKNYLETIHAILSGNTVLYIDGNDTAIIIDTKGWEQRGIEEPDTESVVRGPREGFSETLRNNTALLRRKIKNPNLKFEVFRLGEQTQTDICICYIKGIAREDIIDTVKRRINNINTDAILESGYIEEFIEDAPLSIFPTVGNSEKPDVVAAKLLEGRVAILCDGTPFVLTVPYLFMESLQASEDYYARPIFSSIVRLLRLLALAITTFLPAFYVALVAFHQNVIPFKLLLTIASSREGIPFSPFMEALLMGIIFELLREAGVRMPRPIGQAISIVGALVLGEASVEAGLVSDLMVIITAITAITSFVLPPLGGTVPMIRIALLIGANVLGLVGLGLIAVVFIIHLCTIRSFGVPYMSPFSPLSKEELKDSVIRVPIWEMLTRPRLLTQNNTMHNKYRMKINFRKKED